MMAVRKWLVLIVFLCAASSCLGGDGTVDQHGCRPEQYWSQNECQSCGRCPARKFQLAPCSSSSNTVCLSYKMYKIGMRCLGHRRPRWRDSLSEDEWISIQRQACSSIDRKLLELLHTKLSSEDETNVDREWLDWIRQKEQRRVTKRETMATIPMTDTDISTTTMASSVMDLIPHKTPVFPAKGRRPHILETQTSDFLNNKGEQQIDVPKLFDTSARGHYDSKASTNPVTRPTTLNNRETGLHSVLKQNPPTGGPSGNNKAHAEDKTTRLEPSNGDRPGNVEDDSSGTSSWFSDHTELLYSLLSAGAVVLVLTVFIASRLKTRGKRTTQLKPNTLKVEEKSNGIQSTNETGDIELEDVVSKDSPVTTIGTPKTRKSLSYDSDIDLAKNIKFSLSHSLSSNLEMNNKRSDDSFAHVLKSTASLSQMDWLSKTYDVNSHNDFGSYHSEAETQTDRDMISHNTQTVFGTKWQFSGTFSRDGGVLQRDNSDVTLVVGREAVPSGSYVTIQGAIFTDASEIRGKFGIASNEMLITPLVEYHAEGSYQFQHHVAVKLPHALPDDYDISLIKFYTFTVDDCGSVLFEPLPLKSKDNSGFDDTDAYWEISNQGRCFIAKTKHFSGYFCTTCESKSKLPSVYARVFGSHIQIKSSRREVRLILYLWDRRLNIKDFIHAIHQQECDMDRQLLADEPVPLLDNPTSDSGIVMKMETLGDPEDQKLWRHVTRSNASRPLFRPLQVRKLHQIVLCCQQSDPMRVEWAMENVPDASFPSNVFQCLIEMVHVPEGITNYEEALQNAEEEYIRTFYVRNLKLAKNVHEADEDSQSKQDILKKTMSHILDRQDLDGICQAFGLNKKDIGNLSKKFESDIALKTGLLDECARVYGGENFLRALPHVLKETQLFHVIEYLQDRDLLSTIPSCKQGYTSGGPSLQQQPAFLRQLSESTVCKSVNPPQLEFELSQQQSNCLPSNLTNANSSVCQRGAVHNPNQLRLNIHSGLMMKNEECRQVSPDSDYSSPSAIPGKHQINNLYGNLQNTAMSNISTVSNSVPRTQPHNSLINYNLYNNNIDPSLTSATLSTCNNVSIAMQQNGSCCGNYTSVISDDSDFDDSCQAVIDSMDLKDPERLETDTFSVPEHDNNFDETSRKELAVSGLQTVKPGDTCVAYPEVPEEEHVFHNGPLTIPNVTSVTPGDGDNRHDEEQSPQNDRLERVGDDTLVKETFI